MGSRVVPLRSPRAPSATIVVADDVADLANAHALAAENDQLRIALAEAEDAADRLAGIVDSVADAIFTIGMDLVITAWNRGAEALYGYTAEEVLGREATILYPPGSDEPRRLLAVAGTGERVRGHESVRRARDGTLAEVSLDASPHPQGIVVVARDISDRRELEAELVRQNMHDALTGLPNRAFLTYRLAQALAEARRSDSPVSVLVVDLDRFRAVDELHGHVIGDRVLVEIAGRLRDLAHPGYTVARSGSDEFVLVCPGLDVAGAGAMARLVIEAVGEPLEATQQAVRIGASVGIAVTPPLEGDAATLLQHAEVAMSEAKARGRSRSQVFDASFARHAAEQRRVAADLREALAFDKLDVHYQPVLDLTTDRLVGVEALARWQHPVGGNVPPGTFIPLAEKHGFIGDLDRWVIDRACLDVASAIDSGDLPPNAHVAVNLSARSLDDPGLVAIVADAVRRSRLPAQSLVLEVTETAVLQNRDAARSSLEALRALGVGIHLDDFGTGYSSLSFLRELPVTGVKIDRSFVRDAVDRPDDLAITEAIVRLARGLGLATVAEGVETVEQRDLLRRLGCATAQGFWWSPAVPLAALATTSSTRLTRGQPSRAADGPRTWNLTRRTAKPFVASTACCLRGGIETGQGWLVISSRSRRESFAAALGPVHPAATARGQLVELDAYETLRAVTGPDGRLDPARFEQVVGAALRRLSGASEIGIHAELGHVTQPLLSLRVSTDLRRRLHAEADVTLDYSDQPADCAAHGPLPAVRGFAADSAS